jgi:hypothetical protein
VELCSRQQADKLDSVLLCLSIYRRCARSQQLLLTRSLTPAGPFYNLSRASSVQRGASQRNFQQLQTNSILVLAVSVQL